jgi:3-oxoacyl-(acyl-carrier-protein) synthase
MPTSSSLRCCAKRRIRPITKPGLFGSISERLADRFGTRGLPVTLSTACASGATAIQLGVEAIRQGRTDRALCVATDGSVSAESLIRFFTALGAVDQQ